MWGNHDHSFIRGPVHPYTTRDYYAPENRHRYAPHRLWNGHNADPVSFRDSDGAHADIVPVERCP